jgi:putative ABC transport system permease protein
MEDISPLYAGILGITLFIIALTLLSALFNKIIFRMSFRNAYRRKGTTLLVILGSLVGTALITGSQVINDSFVHTAEVAVDQSLGEIDVTTESVSPLIFDIDTSEVLKDEYLSKSNVDSSQGINAIDVSIRKLKDDNSGIIKGSVSALSGNWKALGDFGSDPNTNEKIEEPKPGEISIIKYVAESLGIEAGDRVVIFTLTGETEYTVSNIHEGLGTSGYTTFNGTGNLIMNSEDYSTLFGIELGSYNTLLVSHAGGVLPKGYDPIAFVNEINDINLEILEDPYSFSTTEVKDSLISSISENGTDIIFSALSIFGIFAGALLIVNIYTMLAEERKSEMGILRAIAFKRRDLIKAYTYEGLIYSLSSSFFGVIVGIGIGYLLVVSISAILNNFLSLFGVDATIFFDITFKSLTLSFSIGLLTTFLTVVISSVFVSRVNIVSAIRGIPAEPKKESKLKRAIKYVVTLLVALYGLVLLVSSSGIQDSIDDSDVSTTIEGYLLYFGSILFILATSALIRWATYHFVDTHSRSRVDKLVNSTASLLIFALSVYSLSGERFIDTLNSNPAFVFIIGLGLVIALTMLITYNLGIVVGIAKILLSPFKKGVAVIKISLRYPSANRMRTGLTILMYAVIIFIIIFISIYRSSLDLVLSNSMDGMLGGFDGLISLSNNENEIKSLDILNSDPNIEDFAEGKSLELLFPEVEVEPNGAFGPPERGPGGNFTEDVSLEGYTDTGFIGDNAFMNISTLEFENTIEGLSPEDVWSELKQNPKAIAISNKYAYEIPGFPQWKVGDEVVFVYPGSDEKFTKTIVASLGGSAANVPYGSIFISEETFNRDVGDEINEIEYDIQQLFIFRDNIRNTAEASRDLKEEYAKINEFNIFIAEELVAVIQGFINQFIYLMQGFLSFGLLVGLAGLAVIMTRSVNERRQQIGMLRSLGFKRSMILQSFLIESSLIGLLGIIIGIITGSIGGVRLINTVTKDFEQFTVSYPTWEILAIAIVIYLATLLFAILPAVKASKLEPVEATNYPE